MNEDTLTNEEIDSLFKVMKKEIVLNREKQIKQISKDKNVPKVIKTPPLLSKDQSVEIAKMLSHTKDREIEVSFGEFKKNFFVPGVSFYSFYNLRTLLTQLYENVIEEHTVEYRSDDIRVIQRGNDTIFQQKKRTNKIDNNVWEWRISESIEEEITDIATVSSKKPAIRRDKQRWSFIVDNAYKYDLTIVTLSPVETIYEVEIEFLQHHPLPQFEEIIMNAMKMMFLELSKIERDAIAYNYNSLFAPPKTTFRYESGQFYNLVNKPLPLKVQHILSGEKYHLTPKFDGVRRFIFFDINGVFSISHDSKSIQHISDSIQAYNGTIIDTEHMKGVKDVKEGVKDVYFPFDILVYKYKNYTTFPFSKRKIAFSAIDDVSFISHKPFFFEENFFNSSQKVFEWMDEHTEYNYDGFIAQPESESYKNFSTYKWKPKEQISIDLRVRVDENDIRVYAATSKGEQQFTGTKDHPLESIDIESYIDKIDSNQIIEFILKDKNSIQGVRLRNDKNYPNFIDVVNDTWTYMHNPIDKYSLIGNTMLFYRRYANQQKRELIQTHVPENSVIFDIGIGRGGDIRKYPNPQKIYGIDVNQDNINELYSRIENTEYKNLVNVEKIGGEETAKILEFLDGNIPNIVSSFFSLSFFFKDEETFENLLKTLNEIIPTGGKFIGATMDGERTYNALKSTGKISTKLYTITSSNINIENSLGNEIVVDIVDPDALVKNQTEYLVDLNYLTKRLQEIGFKLKYLNNIENNAGALSKEQFDFASLNSTFVFEKITVNENIEVVVEEEIIEEEQEQVEEEEQEQVEEEEQGEGEEEYEEKPKKYPPGWLPLGERKETHFAKFVSKPKKYLQSLQLGDRKIISIQNNDYERVGVLKGHNSFFHSIYYLLSVNYRKLFEKGDRKEMNEYICKQRSLIGKKIEKELFDRLMQGNVSHNIAYELYDPNGKINTEEKAKLHAYATYKNMLSGCNEWIGSEMALYFAEKMNCNIHIIDLESKKEIYNVVVDNSNGDILICAIEDVSFEPLLYVDEDKRKFKGTFIAIEEKEIKEAQKEEEEKEHEILKVRINKGKWKAIVGTIIKTYKKTYLIQLDISPYEKVRVSKTDVEILPI